MIPLPMQELGERICDFLLSCGGPYTELTGRLEWNVFFALGSGQYALIERHGEIVTFMAYFRIDPEEIDCAFERNWPADLKTGSVVYITEAGNRGTRRDMAEAITEVRRQNPGAQGVIWHRPAKQDKVYHFPSQRGITAEARRKEAPDGVQFNKE